MLGAKISDITHRDKLNPWSDLMEDLKDGTLRDIYNNIYLFLRDDGEFNFRPNLELFGYMDLGISDGLFRIKDARG